MLKKIWYYFLNFINSRTIVLVIVFVAMSCILIHQLFVLQIVNGASYLDEFELKIRKERTIKSTRGTIMDRNGELLAYNELAYAVTMEDVFESGSSKNAQINQTLQQVLQILKENGDRISTDFKIYLDDDGAYAFTVTGTQQQRFLADIYGEKRASDMTEKQKNSTADDVISYLAGTKRYAVGSYEDPEDRSTEFIIGKGYTKEEVLQIVSIRYAMSANSYQKYLPTTIATEISDQSVAVIMENLEDLPGIDIAEETIRKYTDGPYFSHIIGYTGTISQEELDTLNSEEPSDDFEDVSNPITYDLTDIVGKSGIEKVMDRYLQGVKGHEVVYVDSVGKEIETSGRVEPIAGGDVYLTIDADLQATIYRILEQRVAGILLQQIRPIKEYTGTGNASNIVTPIYDVYNALFANNVIDLQRLSESTASQTERDVYAAFLAYQADVFDRLEQEMTQTGTPYQDLTKEYQVYESYIVNNLLTQNKVLQILDNEDPTYLAWAREETISLKEFLEFAISSNWIDVSKLNMESQYSDSGEVYQSLISYILTELDTKSFDKKLYKYMLLNDRISPQQVCLLLIEQDVVNLSDERIRQLESGAISPYNFMLSLIENLEITPAQLALDPYSASCVITDVNTGEVLALVSYPSYDNNRLANGIDSEYYARIATGEDLSKPMWNYATQMKTAPGSTFKMVSATAGYLENIFNTSTTIDCNGVFTRFSDRVFRCWIYPRGSHGLMNMQNAIKNSCNIYFYELGYRLGLENDTFNSALGTERLAKYADLYGLSETSGIEIEESEPQVSDQLSVPSAIGQGNHNYTTVGLARYVTAVANSGTVFNLSLLDKVNDHNGNLLKDYTPEVRNTIELPDDVWNAIHAGMRGVVEGKSYFENLPFPAAGKTGTAQEDKTRPNHALFVGYMPYDAPEIVIATRVANGYNSDYAAQISEKVLEYYYNRDAEAVMTGKATKPGTATASGD